MKMTSSIFAERRVRGPWAPSTHATASTTLDLPLPLGPTTTVMPGSNSSTAGSAKDLNPLRESDFRNTAALTLSVVVALGWETQVTPRSAPPHTWQCSQKNVDRPPDLTRTMVARQRRQAWPSRSYAWCWS